MLMRKMIIPLLITLVFSGCGNDDEGAALIGVWISDFKTVTECLDATSNRQINRRCTDASCFQLNLNADGTFTYKEGTAVKSGNYTGNFRSLTLCIDDEGEEVCETYTVGENTNVTLVLTQTNEATGCITSDFFERIEEEAV